MGSLSAVVLAAGLGKRMRSELPKPLHEVCGVPMLAHVFELARACRPRRILAVAGHRAELIEERFRESDISWVLQKEPLGTGHAVMQAIRYLDEETKEVVVLQADMPLLRKKTVRALVRRREEERAEACMLVCEHPEPGEMGRVIRDEKGQVMGIREYRDASEQERELREVNVGCYCFAAEALKETLEGLKADNAQGEYYLTDVISRLHERGGKVIAERVSDAREAFGVTRQEDLAEATRLMKEMREGG